MRVELVFGRRKGGMVEREESVSCLEMSASISSIEE